MSDKDRLEGEQPEAVAEAQELSATLEVPAEVASLGGADRPTAPGGHLSASTLSRLVLPALPGEGRVGLLGGSFNPPHLGHAMLAYAVLATEGLDQLWIMPTLAHAFGKESSYAPFEDRIAMCQRAFAPFGRSIEILDLERHMPQPNYTYQLLHALHQKIPGIRPHLIVGSDILDEFDRWTEPEQILGMCQILVVPRGGYPGLPHEKGWPQMRMRLEFPVPEISSTDIRRRLATGEPADGLVARDVLAYIEERGLYR